MKKNIVYIAIAVISIIIIALFVRGINSEVLNAFGTMNEEFEQSNASAQEKIDSLKLRINYTEYTEKIKNVDSR